MAAATKRNTERRTQALQRTIERLEHGLRLARIAGGSVEPHYGALHLLHALKAIEKDLPELQAFAHRARQQDRAGDRLVAPALAG